MNAPLRHKAYEIPTVRIAQHLRAERLKLVKFTHPCNWCGTPYESEVEPEFEQLIREHSICPACLEKHEAARDMEGEP